MRQVIYRPDKYFAETPHMGLTLGSVSADGGYTVLVDQKFGGFITSLTSDQALRLAGYILATHPEAAGSEDFEGLAFAPATASCEELPHPDFVVVPPVDGTEHTNPLQCRADLSERLDRVFSKIGQSAGLAPASAKSEPPAADEPEDVGLLHPDQDRRVTALREARDILGPHQDPGQLRWFAEWILDGRPETAEGGEQA